MNRNYGIDLLRIVSMQMIVVLHVLGCGGILENLPLFSTKYNVAYLLETFCYCSVNCFALTSGYVLYGRDIKISKLMELWLQIVFYTIPILLLFFLFAPSVINLKIISQSFLPISTGAYWYLSSYFGLYIFIPLLNYGIERMDKKTFSLILISVFVFLICPPIPFHTDPYFLIGGYSMIWLIILYLFGAYIRKYNFGQNIGITKGLIGYGLFNVITFFISLLVVNIYHNAYGEIKGWGVFMRYSSPTVLLSSIFLFLVFVRVKIPVKLINYIILLSPTCLGVYIIHTNFLVFNNLLKDMAIPLTHYNVFSMLLFALLFACLIYLLCSLIDLIRIYIFKVCGINSLCKKFESFVINKINKIFPNNPVNI